MKKLFFALLSVTAFSAFAQNTFPTTGNVGIGTTSPSSKLQLLGDFTLGGSSYLNQTKLYFQSSLGSWSLGSQGANSNNFMIYSYDPNADFKVFTGTLERFVVKSNGNVGIGITLPTHKLDIDGNIRANGRGYFQNTSDSQITLEGTDTWAGIEFKDVHDKDYLWFRGQHKTFAIGGGGSNVAGKKLHIHGGTSIGVAYVGQYVPANGLAVEGNVGIGITSPTEALDVVGDAQFTGEIGLGNNKGLIIKDSGGNYKDVIKLTTADHIQVGSSTVFGDLKVISTGNYLFEGGGNVGIGVANPNSKLAIRDSNLEINFLMNKKLEGSWPASVENQTVTLQSSGASAGNIAFASGNNERMRISANGNVGIGITSPEHKLDVNGRGRFKTNIDSQITLEGTDSWSGIEFKDVNGSEYVWYRGHHKTFSIGGGGSNVANKKLHIHGGTSIGETYRPSSVPTNGLAVEGSIGIGTSSPLQKLHLNGNMLFENNTELRWKDASGTQRTILELDANNDLLLGKSAGGNLIFVNGSSYTERMRIDSDGNVGIGTTAPGSFKLNVSGNVHHSGKLSVGTNYNGFTANIGGTTYLTTGSVWTTDNFGFANSASNNTGIFPKSDHSISLKTNNTTALYLESGGNIGIGTTSPVAGYKLSVAGKVIAEELKVQLQSAWPDYVFASDYKLLSVEEVEAFIKKNGHLPNMPSAKEVKKEGGVLLGEMNKKLLEKVEELTLYTIEQEKKIKALEKQNKRIELLEEQMKKLLNEKE
ncbi:hypothetical protein AAON49_05815 [Pseudotenacibaculum sp. MALMAid0570]|uniref:hypothetical protein n=1 Tax=Pseudotenacibaculum sp. MALMAid0570 TaxID=3143938 RepID=UPI0032E00288